MRATTHYISYIYIICYADLNKIAIRGTPQMAVDKEAIKDKLKEYGLDIQLCSGV